MRKQKYARVGYEFYGREGICRYLEKQAARGWLLDNIGILAWRFRRIEPAKLHFSVTYFPDVNEYDPLPNHRQNLYLEYCAHAGWQLAVSSGQMQIFYHEGEDPVPIETDPVVELENIHRSVMKRTVPACGIVMALLTFWLVMEAQDFREQMIRTLSNDFLLVCPLLVLGCIGLLAARLLGYFLWRRRAVRYAGETGAFLPARSRGLLSAAVSLLMTLTLLAAVWSSGGIRAVITILAVFAGVELLYLALDGLRKLLRRREVSASVNVALCFAAAMLLIPSVGRMGLNLVGTALDAVFPEEPKPLRYIYYNLSLDMYEGELPLTVEDLGISVEEPVSCEYVRSDKSVLLTRDIYMQTGLKDDRHYPLLSYNVIDIKHPWIFDMVLECLQDPENIQNRVMVYGQGFTSMRRIDPAPWGADAAWQGCDPDGNGLTVYLLCYGSRIVSLNPEEALTRQQMQTVGEIFG